MRAYVHSQTGVRLRRLAFQINRAARTGDAGAVHDVRVAIRRLSRCLQTFAQFYPGHARKKIRRRLAGLMDACGTVRNLDIAIQLLREGGLPPASPVVRLLEARRGKAESDLLAGLRVWKESAVSRKWKSQLGL